MAPDNIDRQTEAEMQKHQFQFHRQRSSGDQAFPTANPKPGDEEETSQLDCRITVDPPATLHYRYVWIKVSAPNRSKSEWTPISNVIAAQNIVNEWPAGASRTSDVRIGRVEVNGASGSTDSTSPLEFHGHRLPRDSSIEDALKWIKEAEGQQFIKGASSWQLFVIRTEAANKSAR